MMLDGTKETEFIYTTQPYQHQKEALAAAWDQANFAFFMEQGTGKSKIVVDETVNMIERNTINCVVILAPNQVHENWKEQFETHGPKDYDKWAIQVYRSKNNAERQEKLTRDIINSGKVLVFLMNIESLSHQSGVNYLGRILRARRQTYLCIDESHKIKNNSAKRTKTAIALGTLAKYRRILTGTEAEEGLINLYSQFKFLDWHIIGFKFITPFKGFYCIMGGYENREIVGYRHQEMLAFRIAPYVFNRRKKDCLDLPDKVYAHHHIEMTPEQDRMYTQLEEALLLELNDGTLVDATMVLTRFIRLQQVLSGHLGNEDIPSNRASYVAELVESASGKSIIFCRFVRDVFLAGVALDKLDIHSVSITGETNNRLDEINRWRVDPNCRALIITTQTGGTGLTLNEANNTIFYSNSWSATDRLQAEDRNHRIGQSNKVTYHDITVRKRIDDLILKALKNKSNLADRFRQLLAHGMRGKQWKSFLDGDYNG
jgi:SNF2 family DNA or RNA helicase